MKTGERLAVTWRELVVTDSSGETAGTLGWFVDHAPANLDEVEVDDWRIVQWPGFFISLPGEEPDWDTPKSEVDWTGFIEALEVARQ